jgi:predicted GTPase
MGTAYTKGREAGIHTSVHEQNLRFLRGKKERKMPFKEWSAGGHAPTKNAPQTLSQLAQKYLRAIHKRDGTKPRR